MYLGPRGYLEVLRWESGRTAERNRGKPWLTGSCPLFGPLCHQALPPVCQVELCDPTLPGQGGGLERLLSSRQDHSAQSSDSRWLQQPDSRFPSPTRKWAQPAQSNPSAPAWAGALVPGRGLLLQELELKKSAPCIHEAPPSSWSAVTILGT